jgi:phosphoserine aminotransferase
MISEYRRMPTTRPRQPNFASGPCAKRPGWRLDALDHALLGRSHRSRDGHEKLRQVIELTRQVLQIPDGHQIAIVPGSDTGAVEMALWSLLGPRGVDVLAWESFGKDWATDVTQQLCLRDARMFEADYGELPDLAQVDHDRDVIFTWNGSASGVRVPDGSWIPLDRKGLTICDATSAAFAMELPWERLDVTTWSWQKVLGGEGAHGMLVLSPRAMERLQAYDPPWPVPKLFLMKNNGRINKAMFDGSIINTPSMLAVEDAIDGLKWAESIGGLPSLIRRSLANLDCASAWVSRNRWCDFLARRPDTRSSTSICLRIVDPNIVPDSELHIKTARDVVAFLEQQGIAYDVNAYRTAPPGFRLWGGATIETSDLGAVLEWLSYAYAEARHGALATC